MKEDHILKHFFEMLPNGKKTERLSEYGKSNAILEYIKIDGVKAE